MTYMSKNCLNCGNIFEAALREVKRGNGKFCCLKCSAEYNGKQRIKPTPAPNTECAWCHKSIYRDKTHLEASKSGLYFCCNEHKNLAARINGLPELALPHYGTGTDYRNKMFVVEGRSKICERCGFNRHEAAIIVHHKDRNRTNNDISNLEVLCANCHAIEHWGEE